MSAPVQSPDDLLTLQEAVDLGYAKYSTLRRYITDGRLTASKVGRRIRVRRADLDALLVPANDPQAAIDAAIDRMMASAPPLTPEQVRRLRSLLGGA